MCISVPARVIWKDKPSQASIPGRVRVTDGEREVDLIMVPEVSIGDYVVVHSGYAIDVIPRDRAVETIRLLGVEKLT